MDIRKSGELMTLVAENSGRGDRIANRETRRRQLIEATIASIAELGFTDTTLSTVTSRAGLSHGTINFHFKSKEILFIETLKYLAEDHRDHCQAAFEKAGPRPEQQLAAMIEIDFDPVICNDKRLAVWFAFWGETKCRPAYFDICGQIDADRLREFERLCRTIKKEGQYPNVDSSLVAKCLESLIDGIWLNKLCQAQVYRRSEAMRMCIAFLAGCFPRHFPLNDEPRPE
jgi:TetR/AcrR family transcriptional repressor of bet genes